MSEASNPPPVDPEIIQAINYVIMGRSFFDQMKELLKEIREEENVARNIGQNSREGPLNPGDSSKGDTGVNSRGDVTVATLQEIITLLKDNGLGTPPVIKPEDDLLPTNFSMPSFPLYKGTSNPAFHVSNYENIMRMKGLRDS